MKKNNSSWISQNWWAVLTFLLTVTFSYAVTTATLGQRVQAIENRNARTDLLVDRFLQLEERDRALIDDVAEIRSDIKEIKNFINVR